MVQPLVRTFRLIVFIVASAIMIPFLWLQQLEGRGAAREVERSISEKTIDAALVARAHASGTRNLEIAKTMSPCC